jgi:hypothetical protein
MSVPRCPALDRRHRAQSACRDKLPLQPQRKSLRPRTFACQTVEPGLTVGSFSRLSNAEEMEATIEQMAREGNSDQQIAEHLTSHGYRSPQADVVLASTVRAVRLRKRILHQAHQSHPRRVPGFLTIPQLADKLGISRSWLHDRIRSGTIKAVKDPRANCYLFPDTPQTLAELNTIISTFHSNSACRRRHQDV